VACGDRYRSRTASEGAGMPCREPVRPGLLQPLEIYQRIVVILVATPAADIAAVARTLFRCGQAVGWLRASENFHPVTVKRLSKQPVQCKALHDCA